ncbi:UNVERIFIED_ORG: hypothetical protein J2W66_004393 [Agrobacterium larrymoorei]|nr:hypothetical protein [Agrobacterium larrymoorei]
MLNKLSEIHAKADYAVNAVLAARKQVNHPGPLWYHAIGLFNAFYAINEELAKRTQNVPDTKLAGAVKDWRAANRAAISSFFGTARNTATHHGEIVTEPYVEWEWDISNDTEHPRSKAHVTVKNSKINEMPGDDFLDLCKEALTFMRDGIVAINQDYKSRGGGVYELPTKSRFDDLF